MYIQLCWCDITGTDDTATRTKSLNSTLWSMANFISYSLLHHLWPDLTELGLATRILRKLSQQPSRSLRSHHEAKTRYSVFTLEPEWRMESSGWMTHIFKIRTPWSLNSPSLKLENIGTISVNILNHELCKFLLHSINSSENKKALSNWRSVNGQRNKQGEKNPLWLSRISLRTNYHKVVCMITVYLIRRRNKKKEKDIWLLWIEEFNVGCHL